MKKYDLQETLGSSYLRLNGYFTTGLIIYSDESLKAIRTNDTFGFLLTYNPTLKKPKEPLSSQHINKKSYFARMYLNE